MSSSPRRSTVHPALVRDAKDGKWKLKSNFDSDASKLSPRRGGQLRDLCHHKNPHLGPDPHHKIMPKVHVAERHVSLGMSKSSSSSAASPRRENNNGLSRSSGSNNINLSPSFGRRALPSGTNSSENENNGSPSRSLASTKVNDTSPAAAAAAAADPTAIPLDAGSTLKGIAQFEDRLLRLDLRKAEETDNAPTRPDTPVDEKHQAMLSFGGMGGFRSNSINNQQQQQSGGLLRRTGNNPSSSAAAGPGSVAGSPAQQSMFSGSFSANSFAANGADLSASTFNAMGSTLGNIFAQQLMKPDPTAGITFYKANDPDAPRRPWENLTPARAKNPIFGLFSGVAPSTLRRFFQHVERQHPRARQRGLDAEAFAALMKLAAPHVELSEHLVYRAMSYFDVVSLVDNNDNASSIFDQQFPQSISAMKHHVTFPQLLIRFAADSSPRFTDVAVVAVFACLAGADPQQLQPNSAIYITDIVSDKVRAYCRSHLTGDNSIACNRWLAVADALDDPKTMEELKELISDVVNVPPPLQRSDLEKRLFGGKLPNGAPVPDPALITLDQWRYVVYASDRLLSVCTPLRLSVENPFEDSKILFVASKE